MFAQFLSPYIRDVYAETYGQLTRIIKDKGVESILEILSMIQSKVRNLVAIAELGEPMIYVDTGAPKLLPASVLGAGFLHILRLALAMAQLERGILLVDELEDGLHYKTFPLVFGAIIEFLQTRSDVQVFIATHSAELMDAAIAIAAEKQFDSFCLLNMMTSPQGPEIRYFDPSEIKFAKDVDAELR
jgi:hypothetical protein